MYPSLEHVKIHVDWTSYTCLWQTFGMCIHNALRESMKIAKSKHSSYTHIKIKIELQKKNRMNKSFIWQPTIKWKYKIYDFLFSEYFYSVESTHRQTQTQTWVRVQPICSRFPFWYEIIKRSGYEWIAFEICETTKNSL